jgi:hypothetical protein
MNKTILWLLPLLISVGVAQTVVGPVTITGFADAYYSYELGDSSTHERQITPSGVTPVYSHSRNNEFNINNAFIDAKYASDNVRAGLGLQAGTYVDANYAAETQTMRHLYEAVAGFKIVEGIWVDAGIFASHIGLESAVSKDNWTLTRSLVADNTPYFETGAKFTYDPNPKWTFALLILNGWQNIRDNNSNKAVGTLVQYKPTSTLLFNSSTFIGEGRNAPDSDKRTRYFHDFYFTDQINGRLSVGGQFDVGFEERSATDSSLDNWYSGMVIVHYQITERYAASARVEYYHDADGITIATNTAGNFVARGGSVGFDYAPAKNLLWRIELRTLHADHVIFVHSDGLKRDSTYATTSIAVSF